MDQYDIHLLQRPLLRRDEIIVRALHLPFWCSEKKRGTPSAFANRNISVNRLAILPLSEIKKIWSKNIERPERVIEGYAEVSVGDIIDCSEDTTILTVVEAVEGTDDLSHAEIMATDENCTVIKKISKGVANKILNKCRFVNFS